jgi:hypothetical protein
LKYFPNNNLAKTNREVKEHEMANFPISHMVSVRDSIGQSNLSVHSGSISFIVTAIKVRAAVKWASEIKTFRPSLNIENARRYINIGYIN